MSYYCYLLVGELAWQYLKLKDVNSLLIQKVLIRRQSKTVTQFIEESPQAQMIVRKKSGEDQAIEVELVNNRARFLFSLRPTEKFDPDMLVFEKYENGDPNHPQISTVYSLSQLLQTQQPHIFGQQLFRVMADAPKPAYVRVTVQDLVLHNNVNQVITFTDVSEFVQNSKLTKEMDDLHLISRSIKHEVTTPLRCMSQIADEAIKQKTATVQTLQILKFTSNLCLSFVEGKMDQILISHNQFEPFFEQLKLFEEVIRPVVDMFSL